MLSKRNIIIIVTVSIIVLIVVGVIVGLVVGLGGKGEGELSGDSGAGECNGEDVWSPDCGISGTPICSDNTCVACQEDSECANVQGAYDSTSAWWCLGSGKCDQCITFLDDGTPWMGNETDGRCYHSDGTLNEDEVCDFGNHTWQCKPLD